MGTGKVSPKKRLGQHFLKDRRIAASIVNSLHAGECDIVVEIGPGMGILTGFLLERGFSNLKLVELDREAVEYLNTNFNGISEIISCDFLDLDLGSLGPGMIALIGNLPYNISSQIFFRLLENRNRVPEAVFMVQKEVAERICSSPGSRVYGILSVLLQAWYNVQYLFTVSEKVFLPPPKVKSAVIRLTRNDTTKLGCDEELFAAVVKNCFNQRRKMIRNSARKMVKPDAAEMPLLTMRPEQLSVDQFVELTNWVYNNSR